MAFLRRRVKESFVVPRRRLIWASLVLFFVGGAICSFNPPADDGQRMIRREHIMESQTEGKTSGRTDLKGGAASAGIETATFALG
ncbi:MAG: hypothetical protein WAW37_06740 [Syntrophobacteraceae bacterium]